MSEKAQKGKQKANKPARPLSIKQQVFIAHYLTCWNATEAAIKAGYSPKTAQEQGSRLLSNVMVQKAIQARVDALLAESDEMLLRLADHSRGSIEYFLDEHFQFSLEKGKENGKLHLIKKFKTTKRIIPRKDEEPEVVVTIEAELHDAQAATVQLGRTKGLFLDKTALTDPSGQNEWAASMTPEERAKKVADLLEKGKNRLAEEQGKEA